MNEITHFQIKTIIPLEYEREAFLKNLNAENGIFSSQSILKEVTFSNDIYNEQGKQIFTEQDKQVYLAKIKNPADAGLYHNKGVTYITNARIYAAEPLHFEMDEIYIFFHSFRAYLIFTANIPITQYIGNTADASDLYSKCLDYFTKNLTRRGERTFCYKDNTGTQKYSYKALAETICQKLNAFCKITPDLEHIYSQSNLLLKNVPENSNTIYDLMENLIFSGNAREDIHNSSNQYIKGDWQVTDLQTKKNNWLFWGYGKKQFLIMPNEQFRFTNGPSSGFYKSIHKNYMALYTLWIDSREKLLQEKGNNKKAWQNIRTLLASVLTPDNHQHINDIFTQLANAAAENPQDIAVSLQDGVTENDYIFVSYSHRDFVKVYCDLYFFNDRKYPFWYDRGLYENADEEWHKYVNSRLESPNCKGVLFYLSENFLLSKSAEKEVRTVLSKGKPYFIVSLSKNPIPGAVLKEALVKAPLAQVQDNDFMNMVQTMASAFPNTKTVLNPLDGEYYRQIAHNIEKCLSEHSV